MKWSFFLAAGLLFVLASPALAATKEPRIVLMAQHQLWQAEQQSHAAMAKAFRQERVAFFAKRSMSSTLFAQRYRHFSVPMDRLERMLSHLSYPLTNAECKRLLSNEHQMALALSVLQHEA